MKRKSKKLPEPKRELPPLVEAKDLKWPEMGDYADSNLHDTSLTFYKVKDLGWVLVTLLISKSRRDDRQDRYYAIGVADEKVYRVGKGPHVLETCTVHLKKSNLERLTRYVELHRKGQESAGTIRDRISSRRAQGQLHRAAGRTYWMW